MARALTGARLSRFSSSPRRYDTFRGDKHICTLRPSPDVAIPLAEGAGDLLFLFLATLPFGAVIVRAGEWFVHRKMNFSVFERGLLAFYAAGAVFFAIASLPAPLYWSWTPLLVLAFGAVAYSAISVSEGGRGARWALHRLLGTVSGICVVLGTTLLFVFEFVPSNAVAFPNAWDGSATTLWMALTLSNHTLPWTLVPYASWGVVYPLGTAVWMTLPVALLGWPITSAPQNLTPLFLSLSFAGSYCWGSRLDSLANVRPLNLGFLFAIFFAGVAAWPRLFVGGSYDFALAAPLLFVFLGWTVPLASDRAPTWRETAALGVVLGILGSLSAVAAEAAALILVATVLVSPRPAHGRFRGWTSRIGGIVGIGLGALVRSWGAVLVWFRYPGHVLTAAGSPPYAVPPPLYTFNLSLMQGELDPFVLWKEKISPVPFLAVELQVLLAVGTILAVLSLTRWGDTLRQALPVELTRPVLAGATTLFLATALTVVSTPPRSPLAGLELITSPEEFSVLLFIFFQVIMLFPLILLARWSLGPSSARGPKGGPETSTEGPAIGTRRRSRDARRSGPSRAAVVMTAFLLAVPFGSGLYASVSSEVAFVHGEVAKTANVTASDVMAMEWMGSHLPGCSRVLVAPGSAGEYLPQYAMVHLVYPMTPPPVNLSYYLAVDHLINGSYDPTVGRALTELGVTEVLGTGQTSVSYLPFRLGPVESGPGFEVLFVVGDATVLGFLPVLQGGSCLPT